MRTFSVFIRVMTCGIAPVLTFYVAPTAQTQAPQTPAPSLGTVRAITPPAHPLPSEAASAGVPKFSFLGYGDTRGRRDGTAIQYEHSLIVESMIATIKRLSKTEYPVKFVVQSGDAVVSGREVAQWNVSYFGRIIQLPPEQEREAPGPSIVRRPVTGPENMLGSALNVLKPTSVGSAEPAPGIAFDGSGANATTAPDAESRA